ncbi:unnamed protein product [Nesidiocoris tenuis]|uniref:Uncharacterized protein n=1 Tax=Nesidiocoris tenuis TaxID=355587 RepID=A0A6H5FYQ1_9HEMI|nr:unnamed protein product [Nesidiocoris tenuis]
MKKAPTKLEKELAGVERRYETVKFGEVVHGPPNLNRRPRGVDPSSKVFFKNKISNLEIQLRLRFLLLRCRVLSSFDLSRDLFRDPTEPCDLTESRDPSCDRTESSCDASSFDLRSCDLRSCDLRSLDLRLCDPRSPDLPPCDSPHRDLPADRLFCDLSPLCDLCDLRSFLLRSLLPLSALSPLEEQRSYSGDGVPQSFRSSGDLPKKRQTRHNVLYLKKKNSNDFRTSNPPKIEKSAVIRELIDELRQYQSDTTSPPEHSLPQQLPPPSPQLPPKKKRKSILNCLVKKVFFATITCLAWTSCRKNSYRLKRHFTQNYSILTTSLSVASTEKPVLGLHIPAGRQYYLYTGVIYTVPTGTYELEDLQKLLKAQLDKLYGIKFDLDVNLNTLQCGVKCSKKIDFGFEDTFGELLGFNPKAQLIPNQYNWSTDIIHVFKVSTIGISVSCCEGSYINDQESHVIYQFSPDVEPGYKLRQEPALVTYHPVVGEKLETVTIKVVDQDGTLIDFRNELIVVRLHFKIRA